MKRLTILALGLVLLLAGPGGAQIRNVTINSESEEGKLLQQAGEETDSAKKIAMLEEFLSKYGSHDAAGYVHLQLQAEYLKVNNFDKSVEHGEAAQAKAPNDLEIAHLLVKGGEGKGDAQRLVAAVEKARDLAQKAKAAPKTSDGDEEAWKRSVDFAGQVDQYNQYALFGAAQKQTAPQAKVLLLDTLRKDYPGGQFDKSLDAQYVVAYQQLGQMDKMAEAAEGALAGEPDNEAYLYLAGEAYMDPSKGKVAQAEANAQKILATLPNKPKPANVSDDDWAKNKSTYLGLGHSLLGRSLANQGKFAPAFKELQVAVTALKGNNEALAPVLYFLGFCGAKLERHKDAITYLTQASKIPGPYQAPATDLLNKVRAALGGR
jgi:tetratricopeptide (TPR) repeat protein